jgi:hypothetical protein
MVGRTHINDVDAFAAQLLDMQQRMASLERSAGRGGAPSTVVGPWTLENTGYGPSIRPTANTWDNYTMLGQGAATFLNAPPGGTLYFRIGNTTVAQSTPSTFSILPTLSCNAVYCGDLSANSLGSAYHVHGNTVRGLSTNQGVWNTWGILSWAQGGGGGLAINGIYLEGTTACGWRMHYQQGNCMYAVAWDNGSHTPVGGERFDTLSTITHKRGVRPLRPERERITVDLDPAVDELAEPDIMSLRPVAFRYKRPAQRIPLGSDVGEDWPADEIIGAESRRERLGLIGEEVQHVIPSAVSHDSEGNVMGIDYAQVTVALLDHVQRLTDEVGMLRAALAQAHDRIDRLENP